MSTRSHAAARVQADASFALKLLAARRELLRLRRVVRQLSDAAMQNADDEIADRALQKALALLHRQVLEFARLDHVIELSDQINAGEAS